MLMEICKSRWSVLIIIIIILDIIFMFQPDLLNLN